jgi:transcriptional regulator with PAS, ATPase and Fis domain
MNCKKNDSTRILKRDNEPYSFFVRRGKLVIISGPDRGKTLLVVDRSGVTIGSAEDNCLVLSDPTVSRHHAVLMESAGGYLAKDLGSTNGTYLNGVLIKEAYLGFGGVITLGETQIGFVPFEEKIEVFPSKKSVFGKVYGQSVEMRTIFGILERVAATDVSIVLEGETGTGKELIARAIHTNSSRVQKPFVVFDCSSVAENLIESELFGHEKGAFTGADRERKGVFEQAHEGTVFLDEIGELEWDLQPKLLRVLETKEVKRVGGNSSIQVNVRMVAATHRDLSQEVKQGRFREDLFYRISVLRLYIPPLRERKEDISLITYQLLRNLALEYGIDKIPEIVPETFDILKSHHWPGNVRELRNVLNRALAMGDRVMIQPKDLLLSSASASRNQAIDSLAGMSLEEIEKTAIMQTLNAHQGNKTQTAKVLGVAYSTLHEKIKKYGIR